MTNDFTDVPVFVTVVEVGGFSAAARRLNLSRSAVGKAVARLEARLSARLFHRTTRSQTLTEDGQIFFEHCKRALDELHTGKTLLDTGRSGVSGRLRVSLPVLFGRRCAAPVLVQLTSVHPRLELDVSFTDRVVDLFDDGIELAVRNGPLGDGPGLMVRRVARERTMIFASPDYLDRHRAPETLADLERHQAITYSRNGRAQVWRFPRDAVAVQEVAVQTRLRFDDLEAIADAAIAGAGLAWLPGWLVSDAVRSGQLVPVLTDHPPLVSDIHVVWPATPHQPARVRVAIDALAAALPGETAE